MPARAVEQPIGEFTDHGETGAHRQARPWLVVPNQSEKGSGDRWLRWVFGWPWTTSGGHVGWLIDAPWSHPIAPPDRLVLAYDGSDLHPWV